MYKDTAERTVLVLVSGHRREHVNKVDEQSITDLATGTVDCLMRSLENLLEKQMGPMQIRDEEKRKMARQQLLGAYVDVAKSLEAHELGNFLEESAFVREATQKSSEMRAKLSRVGA